MNALNVQAKCFARASSEHRLSTLARLRKALPPRSTSQDPQVKRRFTMIELPELVVGIHSDMFCTVMADYCGRVGLMTPIEADLIDRIFHGARYRFGRAIELLLVALEFAIEGDDAYLTIDHFASAYAMNEACAASENVFYVDNFHALDPDRADVLPSSRLRRKRKG